MNKNKQLRNIPNDKLNFWTWFYLALALFMFPGVLVWILPLKLIGAPEDLLAFFLVLSWPFGLWCAMRGGMFAYEEKRRKYDGTRKGSVGQ